MINHVPPRIVETTIFASMLGSCGDAYNSISVDLIQEFTFKSFPQTAVVIDVS